MRIDAIGVGSSFGYGAWADLIAASPTGAAALGRIAGTSGSAADLDRLVEILGTAGPSGAGHVTISEAAVALLSLDGDSSKSSLGELAQALILALILQLLDPGSAPS